MKTFRQFSQELLSERVLSIGINPDHEPHREKHRQEMHDILRKSYESIGGYSGLPSGSKEESDSIHNDISNSLIKATKRNGKISSVSVYKRQHGRKAVAIGTDGTPQGKKDFLKTAIEDNEHKRAWGEFSGAIEHIGKKIGMPVVPANKAKELTGKSDIEPDEDQQHYTRKIGSERRRKIIMGHPKQ